jgi:hypothetical protein
VLWHQSLLTFAQRYKHELTDRDREQLKPCLRLQVRPARLPAPVRVKIAGLITPHGKLELTEISLRFYILPARPPARRRAGGLLLAGLHRRAGRARQVVACTATPIAG